MKPNFLKEQSSTTVVAEKPSQTSQPQKQEKTNIFAPKPQETAQPTPQVEKQDKPEKPKINLFSAKTFEDAKEQGEKLSILSAKKVVAVVEEIAPKPVMEEVQEDEQEQFVAFSAKPKSHKKEWKFRLKLVTAVYCAVIAVMTGWVTTNAIRIANINNTISSTQTEIGINQAKYINEIQKLDDLKNQEPDYNNTNLIPIEEIISVTPLPLEDLTEYEMESNWFDNIVNWFGNLFGG